MRLVQEASVAASSRTGLSRSCDAAHIEGLESRLLLAATSIRLSSHSVAENMAVGTLVGTLSIKHASASSKYVYSFPATGGDPGNSSFTISGNKLLTAQSFDYEAQKTYYIELVARDQLGHKYTQHTTISITNVNEAPTNISLSNASVAENSLVGTVIGNLSTTDPDAGNTFTYSLVSGTGGTDNGIFKVVGSQLEVNGPIDYETKNSFSILVQTKDQGGLTFQKMFTISATNVNEAPTDIILTGSTFEDHAPVGTVVGTLSTIDPDVGDTHTYSLVAGTGDTDNDRFKIVGDEIQLNGATDVATQSRYLVRVQSKDAGGLTVQKAIVITGIIPAESPSSLNLSGLTVVEFSAAGTLVGTLSSTDPEPGDTATYSLSNGQGDNNNGLFKIVGDQLQVAGTIDYTTTSTCSVRVMVTDQHGLTLEKQFAITVQAVAVPVAIQGTSADDVISVSSDGSHYSVTVNGTVTQYLIARVSALAISGFEGNDSITIGDGVMGAVVDGGSGNDTIIGGPGNDTLYGGAGDDLIRGGGGNDVIYGNGGNDLLFGGVGDDCIYGGRGADSIKGGDGNDSIYGGAGNDLLRGNVGNDYIDGKVGDDIILGGDGNDTLIGGAGNDVLYGGAGNDYIDSNDSALGVFHNTVSGGDGADTCIHDAADVIMPDVETLLV